MFGINKKRITVKFRRYFRKINKKDEIKPMTEKAISLARRLIAKKESTLLLAPVSGTCYIEYGNFYIAFNEETISVTNGKYSYYFYVPFSYGSKLKSFFYTHIENRRKVIEDKYDMRTLNNLNEMMEIIDKSEITK